MKVPAPGTVRLDSVLEPVMGRAIPVKKGEIFSLTQMGDGQRVEFNCFNLHDYKERMSVGACGVKLSTLISAG